MKNLKIHILILLLLCRMNIFSQIDSVITLGGGHTSYVYSVAISQDGKKIVTGSADNTAKIWDAILV